MGSVEVYVQLLGEGVVVFRPTQSELLRPAVARLLAPSDYDPETEAWEFKPGSVVAIEHRQFDQGEGWVAVSMADPDAS